MEKRLKIGLVTGEFPPMEGGIGDFTCNLAKEIATKGHEVHILTHRRAKQPIERVPSKTVGEAFQRLGNIWEPQDIEYATIHPRFRRWHWGDMSAIADVAIRHELDVLNVQYQPAAFNMRNPAINMLPLRVNAIAKSIVTFHDLRPPYLFPKAGGLRKRVVYKLAQRAHGAIFTNPANVAEIEQNGFGTQQQTMIPIGNNIPANHVNHIEIAENRKQLAIEEDVVLLGFFGFFNQSKGGDDLIALMDHLDERFHLLIIGGGAGDSDRINNELYIEETKRNIAEKGLESRIHWTNYLPENRVSAWIKTADMLVLPYTDGVSTRRGSLMAGLAHGMPIVSTAAKIINPLLKDGENLLLAPAGDVVALANKVVQLADDMLLGEKLGEAALKTAESFSWPKIAEQTLAFYASVLEDQQ